VNRTFVVFLYVAFFFLIVFPCRGQTVEEEKQPLISVLKQLEIRYGISFSYADENLANKTIKIPPADLSLEALLNYLETHSDLTFNKLNDFSIVIRKLPLRKTYRTQFLEEIIVTNYLTKGISTKNDGTVNVKPQEFSILPGLIEPDVLQTIQALPGGAKC